MNLKVWGPLAFATMLFTIAVAIKIISFGDYYIWLEIAPELALWATGVLFSVSITEYTLFGGRTTYKIRRKRTGNGFEVDFNIEFPNELDFGFKYQYLFVYSMMIWILTLLFSGHAVEMLTTTNQWTWDVHGWNFLCLLLSGTTIGAAIHCLFEVS